MRILALFFAATISAAAQTPQVPKKMDFAGITLSIRDDARKEIQKDVDALWQSPRHLAIKVEKARTYFPVIEKIFQEERLPGDFKYLVLQESALIPDAVSVSNAVGYWQFKDFTAEEMGMRVDKQVDERMNIVSSTTSAARYIKKNNFYFNNWLFALQAYQMGAGGVMKAEKNYQSGAKEMDITSKTYWYVKKFLAHKIAFEGLVNSPGVTQLVLFENKGNKNFSELAEELSVKEEDLKEYNKWVRGKRIPDDRAYFVAVPVASGREIDMTLIANLENTKLTESLSKPTIQPLVKESKRSKINGVAVILAVAGDKPATLAERANVDVSYFLKCNDISISDPIIEGQYYFVSRKRTRGSEAYHKVETREDLWKVSQQYGVQLKKLEKFNRITGSSGLPLGSTVWLASKKPKNASGTDIIADAVELDEGQSFTWGQTTPVVAAQTIPAFNKDQTVAGKNLTVVPEAPVQQEGPSLSETSSGGAVSDPVVSEKPVQQPPKPSQHVVAQGETLYGIAKKYDMEVMEITTANNIRIADGIKPGQVLILPDNQTIVETSEEVASASGFIFHEVKSSETLYSVARKYGVTIKELMEWNGKSEFSVSVGERLKVQQK